MTEKTVEIISIRKTHFLEFLFGRKEYAVKCNINNNIRTFYLWDFDITEVYRLLETKISETLQEEVDSEAFKKKVDSEALKKKIGIKFMVPLKGR